MPLLEIRNLTIELIKGQRQFKAVNDAGFSMEKGEILGIAGESGCGKTMTALSIPALLPQNARITGGEIIFSGKHLTSFSEKEMQGIRGKEISMIFQEYRQSLNPLIKAGKQIEETLFLTGGVFNKKNVKKQVLEILRMLGFEEPEIIYGSFPHQLSGGMCQRVMAAIAAISKPRLLLADEPSSSLDDESRERILSLLSLMNREYGTSVLIISHDLSVIQKFCSRYLIMYAGKIVEEAPSGTLDHPLHPYTKALVNAVPDKSKKGSYLETIPGRVRSVEDTTAGCPFAPRCKNAQKICEKEFPKANKTTDERLFYCHFPNTEEEVNHG